jgi:desulfoferrodoxin (superoxide reductase-like protein)
MNGRVAHPKRPKNHISLMIVKMGKHVVMLNETVNPYDMALAL